MMDKKALIAYSTRYGSTRTIANDIALHLKNAGIVPDVIDLKKTNPKQIPPVTSYNVVIIGASVAMFKVARKATAFLKKIHEEAKAGGIPVVYFVTAATAIKEPVVALEKYVHKFLSSNGIHPDLTMAVEPCMNMAETSNKMARAICEGFYKDNKGDFNPDGMNDMRDPNRFKKFLEDITNLL
ncbi:MAG: flavodoxin domain-containing protein [Promethearchaeota archaeon]